MEPCHFFHNADSPFLCTFESFSSFCSDYPSQTHILLPPYVSEVLPPATVAVTILCVLSNNTKTPLPAEMTKKIPCWAWQQCLVHLDSPVTCDSAVLLPLWRQRVPLIFLSRQHWLVYIIWASGTGWETERAPGAHRGCGSCNSLSATH